MKKFFKTTVCLTVTALALVSACACNNGGRDVGLKRRAPEQEIIPAEPLDPDFSVDPEGAMPDEENGDAPCPDCPEDKQDSHDQTPGRKKRRPCTHKKRRPVPFPHPPKRTN